jgi:hypothetical protein
MTGPRNRAGKSYLDSLRTPQTGKVDEIDLIMMVKGMDREFKGNLEDFLNMRQMCGDRKIFGHFKTKT